MSTASAVITAVPDWVPELGAGTRADVYPVSPLPPAPLPEELVLDRDTVTAGYATHRPPYEFSSLLVTAPPSAAALTKIRHALAGLRKARPSVLQRVPLMRGTSAGADLSAAIGKPNVSSSKPCFPLQKPSAKSSLEDWFNRLASGGAFSTAALSKAVPLGPAIVRAVGKVLEMMAARAVPTQRAVWYIRIAVLNECVKQIRPDRPAPSPRVFWTRQLCGLLKAELDALRTKRAPSTREYFMHYVLDLARWQADESLLDLAPWLDRIVAAVRSDLAQGGTLACTPAARVALRAAETFLPEFASSPAAGRRLIDALALSVDAAGGPATVSAPAVAAAAAAASTAAATAAASAALAMQSSAHPASSDGTLAISPSVTTSFRLPPAVRVVALLRSLLSVPRPIGVNDERELASLMVLAKKFPQQPDSDTRAPSFLEKELILCPAPEFVPRLLERLPASGDVSGVCFSLRTHFGDDQQCGERAAVAYVCAWAVRGPMRSSPLAVPIASAVISAFAADMPIHGETLAQGGAPVFQSELWEFLKALDALRIANGATLTGNDTRDDSGTLQDKYGHFVDPQVVEEDDRVVCLLAQLHRVGQFNLESYFKEVGRLIACSHPSVERHLSYVASFPEPSDRSAADSRRALLRRGQRVVGKMLKVAGPDEDSVAAVRSNDVDSAVMLGTRLRVNGENAIVLSTAEAVSGLDYMSCADHLERRVLSTVAFLSSAGAQARAVDWLLEALGGNDNALVGDLPAACAMVYALDNLAPFVAALGRLELCLSCVLSLQSKYDSLEKAPSTPNIVVTAIESTAGNYAARFAPNACFGNPQWAFWVATMTARYGSSRHLTATLLLGRADSANATFEDSVAALRKSDSSFAAFELKAKGLSGPTPDEDLAQMAAGSKMSADLRALDDFVSFRGANDEEVAAPGLGSFVTANAVLGCVVVPAIKRAYLATDADVKHLGSVVNASMELLREGIFDHDLSGARSSLAVELIALLGATSFRNSSEDSARNLNELLSMPWLRSALLPSAGAEMVRRLRHQLELLLVDSTGVYPVTQLVLECVVTLFGGPLRSVNADAIDEGLVIRLLAWVEWGVSEALLTAISDQRCSCAQTDEFGRSVGEVAAGVRFCEQARMLVDVVVRSTQDAFLPSVVQQLGDVTLDGLTQGLNALVAHAVVDAEPEGCAVPRLEREGWAAYDSTRCGMMKALLPHVHVPATKILASLTGQLTNGTTTLRTLSAGTLRPDLSAEGDILCSAFLSRCDLIESLILKAELKRNESAVQSEGKASLPADEGSYSDADSCAVRDSALAVASFVGAAAALLSPVCLSASLCALGAAIEAAELLGVGCIVSERGPNPAKSDEEVQATGSVGLRSHVWTVLEPVCEWLTSSQQALLRSICARAVEADAAMVTRMQICALKADGSVIDPWYLLEGYGRGSDEQPVIPFDSFGIQGAIQREGKGGDDSDGRMKAGEPSGTRLKRTYTTYACMAVR
jgi:hypothetical protein